MMVFFKWLGFHKCVFSCICLNNKSHLAEPNTIKMRQELEGGILLTFHMVPVIIGSCHHLCLIVTNSDN